MRISNKVKRLIKYINVLLPAYEFSNLREGSLYNSIDIAYDFKSDESIRYIATICLNHKSAFPFKSTDIILRIPTSNLYFIKKLIREWQSIGIAFTASKDNCKKAYHQFYKIELNDDGN